MGTIIALGRANWLSASSWAAVCRLLAYDAATDTRRFFLPADNLLADLKAAGIDVVLDDRNERPGVMFADMELIGIPHRIVVGERGLKEGQLEYKGRRDADAQMIPAGNILAFLREKLCA